MQDIALLMLTVFTVLSTLLIIYLIAMAQNLSTLAKAVTSFITKDEE